MRWKIIFIVFVAAYSLLMLISPAIGPDDGFEFLRTIQAGRPIILYSQNFPYESFLKAGRFSPLGAMEYNILLLFSKSPSAFSYYLIHVAQYILFMALFAKLLSKFTPNKFLIYITPVLLSLSPGFIAPWFQLMVSERNLILYLTIFILSYIFYLEKQKIYYLILGLLSANLLLYTKENTFIIFAVFILCHLFFSWKNNTNPVRSSHGALDIVPANLSLDIYPRGKTAGHSASNGVKINKKVKIFNWLILLSAIVFPILYFFFSFLPYKGLLTYGGTTNPVAVFIKSILNHIVILNPIVMLIVLPLVAWRLYRIFIKKDSPEIIYDSLLFSATMYIISFFALNISNSANYFMPVYVFIIPALFYFMPKIWNTSRIWKILASIAGFMLFFNTLPLSLHFVTYAKYMPLNFNKTLDFMVNDIKSKSPDKRPSIFLDGMERCREKITYFWYEEFLTYKGLTPEQFDLKAQKEETPDCSSLPLTQIPVDEFTVFHKGPLVKISQGDYLIVSPSSNDDTKNSGNEDYLKSLTNNYDLVFKTESPLAFPRLSLKEISRYFLSIGASPGQKLFDISIRKPIMQWPNYYVFVKR